MTKLCMEVRKAPSLDDYFSQDFQKVCAAGAGQQVVEPAEHELFIDIDTEEDFGVFLRHYTVLSQAGYVFGYGAIPSKSGLPHRHVIVYLNRPVRSHEERILLQAALGSDRKRELLSWIRIQNGNPTPSVFFE